MKEIYHIGVTKRLGKELDILIEMGLSETALIIIKGSGKKLISGVTSSYDRFFVVSEWIDISLGRMVREV